jgi:hypothetical protein
LPALPAAQVHFIVSVCGTDDNPDLPDQFHATRRREAGPGKISAVALHYAVGLFLLKD